MPFAAGQRVAAAGETETVLTHRESIVIKTTVVGSYPVPLWLRVVSNREGLRDAMLAVLKTQELAGLDVVADGELYRWDVNHAETNGMIDYFVRPLTGIQTALSAAQLAAWSDEDIDTYGARIKVSPERIRREDWVGQARAIVGTEGR